MAKPAKTVVSPCVSMSTGGQNGQDCSTIQGLTRGGFEKPIAPKGGSRDLPLSPSPCGQKISDENFEAEFTSFATDFDVYMEIIYTNGLIHGRRIA
jgi:hypothetical protein